MKKYKWGIIGLGKIANKFAADLALLPNAELYGVASSSEERSQKFAARFEVKHTFTRYQDLVKLKELDVVYIATPHNFHFEHTMLCLAAGKHVLCEKPFSMNYQQAKMMIDTAHRKRLFIMEAMWTRFIPLFRECLNLISDEAIGEIQMVKADFGFLAAWFSQDSRIWNPKLGGGALLDIGIYPLYLATLLLGKPTNIQASASFSKSKVDENLSVILTYPNKKMANLHASFMMTTATEAWIYGTLGSIHLHSRFHHPTKMTLSSYDGDAETIEMTYEGNGYQFEAIEVMRCLENNQLESEFHPHDMTLLMMKLLDDIRDKISDSI